jgi:hypothetical protein
MHRASRFCIAALALLSIGIQTVRAQDTSVKSDVTIYLEGPLLEGGGTVFVLPREVPADEWAARPDQPNPARSDARLDVRVPIAQHDRRLSVRVSGQISIVRFDFPAGGDFRFRFIPALESGVPPEQRGSVLVSVGNTYDHDPATGEEIFVPRVQVFTIMGPDADESETRAQVSDVKLGRLEERYECRTFESALSCLVEERMD